MAKEYKTLKTDIRLPYELSYGATWTRVFEGMAESFWSDGVSKTKPNPGVGPNRLPSVGPRPR